MARPKNQDISKPIPVRIGIEDLELLKQVARSLGIAQSTALRTSVKVGLYMLKDTAGAQLVLPLLLHLAPDEMAALAAEFTAGVAKLRGRLHSAKDKSGRFGGFFVAPEGATSDEVARLARTHIAQEAAERKIGRALTEAELTGLADQNVNQQQQSGEIILMSFANPSPTPASTKPSKPAKKKPGK